MKALRINVYRHNTDPFYGDCTNGGITSKFDDLLLIHDEGFVDIDLNNVPDNAVVLVERYICGRVYKHLEPLKGTDRGCVGWMFGGNLAYTSDSRFPSDYPLCVHDRQETQDQYNLYFD